MVGRGRGRARRFADVISLSINPIGKMSGQGGVKLSRGVQI